MKLIKKICLSNCIPHCHVRFLQNGTLHRALLLLFLTCFVVAAEGQQIISGRVVAGDSAVSNATIRVKNTDLAAQTNRDGAFSIAAAPGSTLIVSHVSFILKEVKVTGSTINIQLEPSAAQAMKEVVVVGYGAQKRSDVTGAVASVDKKRLDNLPNTNFAQALQASIPGISIDQNSGGAEGNANTIRIRGRNSITASTTPLIILDGVPYSGSISDINPSDIESINVLKDASSAAIYGSRGANGVIILTTKKGTRGEPIISYNGFYGIQDISNLPSALTPDEFYAYKNAREPGSVTTSEQAVYDSKIFPDWVDLVTRKGTKQQHTLGVNGGGERFKYYLSGTYLDVEGIAVNDDFKRASTRINLEANIKKWLTLGSNTQLSFNNRSGLSATFADYQGAFRFNPLTTAFNADGTPTIYPWPQDLFFPNPLAPTLAENTDETYKVITNNYLNIDIPFIKGLSYRINTGVEFTTRSQNTYFGTNTRTGLQAKGDLTIANSTNKNFLVENIVNYNLALKNHTVAFTGLYSVQNEIGRTDNLDATGFPNDVLTFYQANVASSIRPSAGYSKETLVSQMARLNYSYKSKYLLTFTARRDGFSGFGANNKYAFFPSVAAAWNVSSEDFMNDSKLITNLKLRASYGSNGNQGVNAYNTLARLSTRSYVDGATTLPGYTPTSLGNPDLRWETTVGFNIGIDFSLFEGRIDGSLDGYTKNTHDLLLSREISSVHGVSRVLQNIGETANKGIELGLNTINIRNNNFVWSTNFSISANRNQIT
ncbi:MAG: SusC/RagA family TonB-linked outer membrane protein, partial [Chitinophagaceae bacterium]